MLAPTALILLALETRGQTQTPAEPPLSPGAPDTPLFEYERGFRLRSQEGAHELVIGGLFQFDADVFDEDRDPGSDFDVRRMRLEIGARIADSFHLVVEPNFRPDGVEIEEASFGVDVLGGDARLFFGRKIAPFNLEEVRTRRWIDFPRFSIVNQLAPKEDHGVFLYGKTPSKRWEYALAAYNGTGEADLNSSKDVAARAMIHPFARDADATFEHLQLGIAATYGTQETDVAGEGIDNELGLAVTGFAPGAELDGERTRVGLEAAWYRGPWFVQAEYVGVRQEMSLGASEEPIEFHGGYVDVSHVLTGESKSFGGVAPRAPYDFRAGRGRGAWVLAARWSELALDPELAGFAVPGTFTDRIRTASVGLNWIPNEHAIVRHALVRTFYSDEVDLGDGRDHEEDAFLIELQVSF